MYQLDNEALSSDKRLGDDPGIPTSRWSTTIASSFFENEFPPQHSTVPLLSHVFHECMTLPGMPYSALASGQPVGSLVRPTVPESYVIFDIQEISQRLQTA